MSQELKKSAPFSETAYYVDCPHCSKCMRIGVEGDCGFDGQIMTCETCKKEFVIDGEPDD